MRSLIRLLIRTSAFFSKEIYEILRQPRLIMTLVLGPFLILLLFGIGYRNEARALRTVFVVEPGSALEQKIKEYASSLGPQLIYVDATSDQEEALRQLRRQSIDLVAVAPPDAYETIRNSQQAVFTLYHNEVDPLQADYIQYFGKIYIDEVNRRVLRSITDEGQNEAMTTREDLAAARTSASEMRAALERGDDTAAREHQRQLEQSLDSLELAVGTSIAVLDGVQQTLGDGEIDSEGLRSNLSRVREGTTSLQEIEAGKNNYNSEAQRAGQVEQNLATLDEQLGEFQQIESSVLVSPFRSESQGIASVQPELTHYFAPAVIVLLLQHLAITFAALSIVREVQLGAMELFRVSPITAGETLGGKYLSYILFGGVIATILTGLVVLALGVPMLGRWELYALAIFALLFAALGIGFVISLIVDTDSQAVQYAMLVLLSSVFFSGFFLRLDTLQPYVLPVAWALPATYAIVLLQDIMLRGTLNPVPLTGLLAFGVGLYMVAWFLLRRRMARE
ncbi:MAG: ABC transporter permease [Ardenticatenales bacterium]|nr:ABC transporter permease [Ardenticatenales bacterium]